MESAIEVLDEMLIGRIELWVAAGLFKDDFGVLEKNRYIYVYINVLQSNFHETEILAKKKKFLSFRFFNLLLISEKLRINSIFFYKNVVVLTFSKIN